MMRKRTSRMLLLSVSLALGGCHRHPAGTLWADHAWVRLAAAPGRPSVAYLTIHGGARQAWLSAVDSKAAGSSELHETVMRSDVGPAVMSMDQVDGIAVPANTTVVLAPQGYHVMLFGLSPKVRPGDRLPLTLRFAQGAPLVVEAKVIAPGDLAPY